jgi:hypothetical protein
MPAIPVWDPQDATYDAVRAATMEGDLLAVLKLYQVSSNTVDNICDDDFKTVFKVSLVESEEDQHDFFECADGKANKIALRHVLRRIKAGNLRSEIPALVDTVAGAPPSKKAKKSSSAADVPSTSKQAIQAFGSTIPADDFDYETDLQEVQESVFEKSEVICCVFLR